LNRPLSSSDPTRDLLDQGFTGPILHSRNQPDRPKGACLNWEIINKDILEMPKTDSDDDDDSAVATGSQPTLYSESSKETEQLFMWDELKKIKVVPEYINHEQQQNKSELGYCSMEEVTSYEYISKPQGHNGDLDKMYSTAIELSGCEQQENVEQYEVMSESSQNQSDNDDIYSTAKELCDTPQQQQQDRAKQEMEMRHKIDEIEEMNNKGRKVFNIFVSYSD